MESHTPHFGNGLQAMSRELGIDWEAKDTPRSSLKVCFGLSFIFNFFPFQFIL